MKIIIIGCGKVGVALTKQLSGEDHDITVIDTDEKRINRIAEAFDVMGIVGNGSSIGTLTEAGMQDADLIIAVTGSDEMNLLCGMFAKKAGHCHAIARVRNPVYSHELEFIKQQMGISTIINPELTAAKEISRLLRFPAANKIDTFANGRVRLIKFETTYDQGITGRPLKDVSFDGNILFCAVERGHEVIIPSGDFVLQSGDLATVLLPQGKAAAFFGSINMPTRPVKNALIVGGGTIGYYLSKDLIEHGIKVRLVERDPARCETLADSLPEATILLGDGTDRQFLLSEGLPMAESFVALTNIDEENILLSMFAKKRSKGKTITKINRFEFDDILDGVDIGSVVYPKYMTCDFIIQYIRALQNTAGSNLKTLYRILDDRVEALEFNVQEESVVTSAPLSDLNLKPNILICCITRGNQIIIPQGNDKIHVGDNVIVVTIENGLQDLRDIVLY